MTKKHIHGKVICDTDGKEFKIYQLETARFIGGILKHYLDWIVEAILQNQVILSNFVGDSNRYRDILQNVDTKHSQ